MKASWAKAFYSGSPSHGRAAACRQSAPKGDNRRTMAGVAGRLQDDLSLDLGQIVGTFPGVQVVLPPGGVPGNVI